MASSSGSPPPIPPTVVVIPTYNERDNIGRLLPLLLDLDANLRVIVVDDNSPDGTGEAVSDLEQRFPDRIALIRRPAKAGIGPAYIEGFHNALNLPVTYVAQMDADFSHAPDDLSRLIAAAADVDVVLGSRYVAGGATTGWPRMRRAISRFGGLYARLILRVSVRDLTGGFKVFRRDALAGLEIETVRSDGYVFQIETTYRAIKRGYRVREVPITFADRVEGKSKLSRRIVAEAVIMVWRLRFSRGS